MSRQFGTGYINRIKVTGAKGRITGKDIAGSNIKDLITKTIDVQQLIPEQLVNSVAKEFSRTGYVPDPLILAANGLNARGGALAGKLFNTGKDMEKASRQITSAVKRVSVIHHAYYVGLLRTMEHLVKNPGVPVQEKSYSREDGKITSVVSDVRFDKTVNLYPDIEIRAPMVPIRLSGSWPGLTEFTLKAKDRIGSKTFWRHTHEGSRAFSHAVQARLAVIKPKDFITNMGETRIGGSTSPRQGAGKFYTKVQYRFKLGVPDWNPQMDALITIPFSTGRMPSSMTASGLIQFDDDGIEVPGFKASGKKLHGVDRLLAAEAYRPWLRRLSAEAGRQMLSYIYGKQVTASTLPAAQSKRKQELRASAALKAKAKAQREADSRASKLQKDKEAFQRHLNNTGRKVMSVMRKRPTITENLDHIAQVNEKIKANKAVKQEIKAMPVNDKAARLKDIAKGQRRLNTAKLSGKKRPVKTLDEILKKSSPEKSPTAVSAPVKRTGGKPKKPAAVDQQKQIDKDIKDAGKQISKLLSQGKFTEAKALANDHFKNDRNAHQNFLDRVAMMEKKKGE